jgi:excisionase family DNA binding protein
MLGIGLTKFYELVKTGEIRTIKLGKVTLVPVSALEALVNRHSGASPQ